MRGNQRVSLMLVCLFLISIIPVNSVVAEDQGAPEVMQAQDINAVFDPVSETTTITWRNTNQLWNDINDLFAAEYRVYRSSSPIDAVNIMNLQYFANTSACTTESIGGSTSPLDCRGINGVHPGHSISFLVPPGVNGSFYYAITTVLADGTEEYTLDVNASKLYEPVDEVTTPIQTPYNVQAYFEGSTSQTTITWINYNDINPILPETGDDAYKTRVWRTTYAISRANGQALLDTLQHAPIAELEAGISSYTYDIPSNTDRNVYYSITYLLPNYSGPGIDYEDVRFLSQNSMQDSLREDNTPPSRAFSVIASFDDNNGSGTGTTTIEWGDAAGEDGESYRIYMADFNFNNTTQSGVQLIATVDEGVEEFAYNLPYGRLGEAYYCVVTIDIYGEYNKDTHPNSCYGPVFEDAFTNWIAEPDNVVATFIGDSTTRITWNDQLGVEGERYHIYWSNYPVPGEDFRENETLYWIGSTTDGVQYYDVILEDGIERDNSFYFVVTEALYEHLSTPYKFTQLVNNTAGPVTEDTRSPDPPNILSGQSAGESLETRVEWRNDANEDGESYYIYRNIGDPFDGGNISSSTLEEDGWELLYGPIVETPQSPNTFLSNVPIEADLERNVWYAVVSEDRFGNLNNEIYPGIGGNAIEVLEDTRAPTGEVSIADESSIIYDSISLVQGEYDIRLELNEYLSLSPEVTITMSDGTLYSEEPETMTMLSDNLNDPDRGPVYSMPLSIDSSIESGNLVFTFDVVDASGNSITLTYNERFVDSNRPTLNIYSPSTATDGSKYLFGEKVTVMASAQDDVRIESFRYKFTYKYGIPGESEAAPWGDVTDLTTSEDGSEVYTKMEFPSALFEPGYQHAVELEALDSAGNRVTQRVVFIVDLCVYNEDGTLLCQYDVNVADPPEPVYEELSVSDPPFLFVWIASGVAVLSMLVAIMVISTSLKSPKQKKKGEDDEDDEDWMSEFIGTSGDLDMDAITGTGSSEEKKEEKVEEKQEEAPQDDEDDPFAVNKVNPKRRRKKSEPEPEPEDDFDDDEDEDDFDDEEEEPKKRSPPKRKAVKRTPPKKRSAPAKRKAVKKKE